MEKFFVIADIHGEFQKLKAVECVVAEQHPEFTSPFGLADGWELVQTGDKNDRGPDTYEVFDYFRNLDMMFPGRVHCLWGNHEQMMWEAAKMQNDDFYIPGNGGMQTIKSYSNHTKVYGKGGFGNSLARSGHIDFFRKHLYFLETEDYFFSHAPIPKVVHRSTPPGFDFRCNQHTLLWSYVPAPEDMWVDTNLVPIEEEGNFYGKHKLSVHGHIHGCKWREQLTDVKDADGRVMYRRKEVVVIVPGVRKYGNAVLLDSACGCAREGYLSCLELPTMKVYDSRGTVYDLQDTPTTEQLERKRIFQEIPDEKVNF